MCFISSPVIYIIAAYSTQDRFDLINNPVLSKLRDNVMIIVYTPSTFCYGYEHYPINFLRNTAISQVRTSHFLMLDMDAWPSGNLEEEIAKLSQNVLLNPKAVVILPIFFLNPYIPALSRCRNILSCTREYVYEREL